MHQWRPIGTGVLNGLKIVAVAIVAQAVWGMARNLCPDKERAEIAVAAIAVLAIVPGPLGMVGAIGLGALVGLALGGGTVAPAGGHVVLPLLQAEVVQPGWVTPDTFLAGYGAAQAVPGPLFTFAAYLGAVLGPQPNGIAGATVALLAVLLPGFLLLVGVLSFWDRFRAMAPAQSMMQGANAAVVGILGAALYSPVFTSAIGDLRDFTLALFCCVLLMAWKAPPWVVVIVAAAGGAGLAMLA